MFGINVDRDELEAVAANWGCRIRELPISYLGVKVGGRTNSVKAWEQVVEKVQWRLRKWDAKKISMGGIITVIKSVIKFILTAMPLYNLSFLPLPKAVDKLLRALQ